MTAVVSKKSITHLEWSKLVEYLSHFCQSKLGESRALDLRPKTDKRAVLYEIELTEAAREVLEKQRPSLEIDLRSAQRSTERRSVQLEPETLIRVGKLMQPHALCVRHLFIPPQKSWRMLQTTYSLMKTLPISSIEVSMRRASSAASKPYAAHASPNRRRTT